MAQEDANRNYSKAIGILTTSKGAYYPQFQFNVNPNIALYGIGGYSYHKPTLNDFDKAEIQGYFGGAGLSLKIGRWRKPEPVVEKPLNGSFRLNYKYMAGKMKINAQKTYQGEAFQYRTFHENHKNIATSYVELSKVMSYELRKSYRLH